MAGNNGVRNTIGEVFNEVADALETGVFGKKARVGITVKGSELGEKEVLAGAEMAQESNNDIKVIVIGAESDTTLESIPAKDERECHEIMDRMLSEGTLDSAVTMHYNFPIGVSTVGRVITPAKGREMFLATTTGTSDTDRIPGMLKNTLHGIAAAKASGVSEPTVGILNVDGARQLERALKDLHAKGYPIKFSESARSDGGAVMRGNDLLLGLPDVMVTDSLTGNVLMKMFSAFTSGGNYESLGYGYGPGIGEKYDRIVCIISRASGAPVISGSIRYAGDLVKGNLIEKSNVEYLEAKKAGLQEVLEGFQSTDNTTSKGNGEIAPPPAKPVTDEIAGIEILDLDNAAQLLWKNDIYAATGMGCTGPVVQVAEEDKGLASKLLREYNYI